MASQYELPAAWRVLPTPTLPLRQTPLPFQVCGIAGCGAASAVGRPPDPRGPQLFPSEPAVPATAHDSPPPRTTHCVKEGLAHAHPAV